MSETRVVPVDRFLCILNGSSTEPYSVSFEIIVLWILSATSWCLSDPEKFIISLLQRPSEMEIS